MQKRKFGEIKIVSKRKGGEQLNESFAKIDVDRKNPILGNKHVLYDPLNDAERALVIAQYQLEFESDCLKNGLMLEETKKIARRVYNGENVALMCWCAGPPLFKPCHAELIKSKIEEILKPFS